MKIDQVPPCTLGASAWPLAELVVATSSFRVYVGLPRVGCARTWVEGVDMDVIHPFSLWAAAAH